MKRINLQNLDLYFNHDKRFKTSSITIYFYYPFNVDYIAETAILRQLIQKTNGLYPTEEEFSYKLKSVYDMNFSVGYTRIASSSTFRFSISFLNPKYITENLDIIKEAVDFLMTSLFNPSFKEENIELEKAMFIKSLDSIYNNKTKYAIKKFTEILFKDELDRYNMNGDYESIEKVTKESILNAYQEMIKGSCYLFVTGDIDINDVVKNFNNYDLSILTPFNENHNLCFIDNYQKEITTVNDIVEEQDINQTIVCFGYRSDIRKNSKYRFPVSLLCGMLGEYFHSTLFQEIREKKSLAYSVSSDMMINKGVLCVYARISSKNIDLVKNIIKEEIKKYQDGIIDEKVFELTKKARINAILKNSDSPFNPLYDLQDQLLGFGDYRDEDIIEELNKCTVDDICETANKFQLDTVYVLKGNK